MSYTILFIMNCTIHGCFNVAHCKTLCWTHYKQQRLKNDDCKERYNEYHKKYQAEHIDKVKEYRQTDSYKESHSRSNKKYSLKNK